MDPNATLQIIRELVKTIADKQATASNAVVAELAIELANAVDDLDGWLSNAGFHPTAWGGRR